jgi:hypothetical protein
MKPSKNDRLRQQQQDFRERVKLLHCPVCDLAFTDAALDWAEAWLGGMISGAERNRHLLDLDAVELGLRLLIA